MNADSLSAPEAPEPEVPAPAAPTMSASAERFFASAISRMLRFVLVFGAALTVVAAWRWGRVVAFGFGLGAAVSYLNFRSLNRSVQALAARVVESQRPEGGTSIVAGFVLRYLLAGMVAYVIFTSSSTAFRGFLFGLCTPVAGMLTEAVVEAYCALRRGY